MLNAKSVLFVLTSHSDLDGKGTPTGTWLEELAASYYPFADGGWHTIISSIQGGKAPIDPASLAEPWLTDAGKRFLEDVNAQDKLNKSAKLESLGLDKFEAVYLVGGAGTAWDFPNNHALAEILSKAYVSGVIGGVCHGVCGLLNHVNGKALANGRRMTCISNKEEEMTGFDKLVPLLPETSLKNAGAIITVSEPFENHVVVDANIITGQNPASAGGVAAAMLQCFK